MNFGPIKFINIILSVVTFGIFLFGCSEPRLDFGKWHMKKEGHQFAILTASEAEELGEIPPAPCPLDNKLCWSKVKDFGKVPKKLEQKLNLYSVVVVESGFSFLQATKAVDQNKVLDDIEWAWKIVLENKGNRYINAYGGYALLDKDDFILGSTGKDWDNNEDGILLKPGMQGIIQGRSHWFVNKASKPHTATRVVKGDYKLFLRHSTLVDEALSE